MTILLCTVIAIIDTLYVYVTAPHNLWLSVNKFKSLAQTH